MRTIIFLLLCGLFCSLAHAQPLFDFDPNIVPDVNRVFLSELDVNGVYGWEIRARDPDNDPMVIEWLSGPNDAVFDVNWVDWTPTESGFYIFIFKVTDYPLDGNSLSDTAAYVVRVRRVNKKPVLLPFGF